MERFFQHFRPDQPPAPPASPAELDRCQQRLGCRLPAPLTAILTRQNGGSFNSGVLHLMGACRPYRHADLVTWNNPHDWKAAFAGFDLAGYIFFADDAFGNQFGFRHDDVDGSVWRFDIQMGEFTEIAPSVAAFLDEVVVTDGSWLLGADLLESFRESGAALQTGQHLSLIMPGLLGGSMEPENLRPIDPATNLYLAGQVVTQIKPLPPGTEVRGFKYNLAQKTVTFETRPPRAPIRHQAQGLIF